MDLSVFFAGTGGSIPTASRGLPALLVRRGGERLLFDCGEGTQRQLVRSVGLADLDAVFLTHFHADHWLGLPGLLKTFDLRGRERPLSIYGPSGLRELISLGLRAAGRVRYELELVELEPGQALEGDGYTIAPVPVSHRVHAFGYVLYEDERPGQLDPQAGVRLLALTHFSSRYPPSVLREEAGAVFGATVVPRDFDTIEIPFRERGAPHLIRWKDQQRQPESRPTELAAEGLPDPAG